MRLGDTVAVVPQPRTLSPLCIQEGDSVVRSGESAGCFKVRLTSAAGFQSASYLVRRRYAWRGYDVSQPGAVHEPNRITLSACEDNVTVATITVGLDSTAGLFVDTLYRHEVDGLRSAGHRVCEFTKLAVEHNLHSKPLLASMFHIAYIYARRIHTCDDLVIEVNPRHVSFYKRMLDFEDLGARRFDARVKAAAVLLRLNLAVAERQIAEMGGKVELAATRRSLYPYFYTAREETGIEWKLRTLR